MRLTYNQPNKQFNWFKWSFIIFCLIIVIGFVYGVILYYTIEKNKTAGFDETESLVIQNTDLTEVNLIDRYHGAEAYHVVYGQTADQTDKIIFVPLKDEQDEKEFIIVDEQDILSKQATYEEWAKQCSECKLSKIIPGIENDQVIWELTYVDDDNRHVLEYVSIYDGSPSEKFRFRQMY